MCRNYAYSVLHPKYFLKSPNKAGLKNKRVVDGVCFDENLLLKLFSGDI